MKYLKLYEDFRTEDNLVVEPEIEFSDKTIDDVLKDDFLKDEEKVDDSDVYQDEMGVYHIKNWTVY